MVLENESPSSICWIITKYQVLHKYVRYRENKLYSPGAYKQVIEETNTQSNNYDQFIILSVLYYMKHCTTVTEGVLNYVLDL